MVEGGHPGAAALSKVTMEPEVLLNDIINRIVSLKRSEL